MFPILSKNENKILDLQVTTVYLEDTSKSIIYLLIQQPLTQKLVNILWIIIGDAQKQKTKTQYLQTVTYSTDLADTCLFKVNNWITRKGVKYVQTWQWRHENRIILNAVLMFLLLTLFFIY